MNRKHLLLKICTLSRDDREQIFGSLPNPVRRKLLLELAELIEADADQKFDVSEKCARLLKAMRWENFLDEAGKDCISKGREMPNKLFAFIRDTHCRYIRDNYT